jgi:hypothetical protein
MKRKFNPTTNTVHFTFDEGVPELVFDINKCSATVKAEMIGHGAIARIGDKAAIAKSAENSYTVTEAMRRANMVPLVEHYESGTGDWDMRAGPRAAPLNPAILKLAERLGKTYEEAQAWFAAKLEAELSAE